MVTNKEIAEAFKKAVPYLRKNGKSDAKTSYICHAIAAGDTENTSYWCKTDAANAAVKIIQSRLTIDGELYNMNGWLKKMGIPYKMQEDLVVQKHRHKWLQMLIKEFSQ